MPSNYIITEPTPSTTTYVRSGRGGAGNTHRINSSSSTTSSRPASAVIPNSVAAASPGRRFFSGIGGAGNAHAANERPALSIDDEFHHRAATREHVSHIGHCGIGGAGNVYRRKPSDASDYSAKSDEDDDARSVRSSLSSKAKMWAARALNRD